MSLSHFGAIKAVKSTSRHVLRSRQNFALDTPRQITGFVRLGVRINERGGSFLHPVKLGFLPFATVFIACHFFNYGYHLYLLSPSLTPSGQT